MLRVGVDVGGTFTDIVVFDEDDGSLEYYKVLTNPLEPWKPVVEALESRQVSLSSTKVFIHATTLGTNMVFGQYGLEKPKLLLITNEGFRDVIEIGRQCRPELYNLFFSKPPPLVPRSMRIGVRGRINARGEVVEPLDTNAIRSLARKWCGKVDVFVVSFLHSYANSIHEVEAARIIREECPQAIVVVSHEVDPRPGEYERTSTAVINALLKPLLARYLTRLSSELALRGFKGKLLVMQSSGGVASLEEACRKPAAFIESGPAAGVIAAAYYARILGVKKALSFDMGGTTAKASAVVDGEPIIVDEYEVGGRIHRGRLVKGSGYPLRIPHIDIVEVSAGGGTIAWVDEGGMLRVGPMSAGANPGPACYGLGGSEPTVTDANLLLGRLPEQLAGGAIRVRRDLAEKAMRRISDQLGLDVIEASLAVVKLANTIMAQALRIVTIERGLDPREFKLIAYGGAGPLHATELAREVGVKEVIIPPMPGVFSALGLIVTDYRHDLVEPLLTPVSRADDSQLAKVFTKLEEKAYRILASEGVPRKSIRVVRLLEMRFKGQSYSLDIPFNGSLEDATRVFHEVYQAKYGYRVDWEEPVIVSAKIVAYGITSKPRLPRSKPTPYEPRPREYKPVFFEGEDWVKTPVYARSVLKPGARIQGPALIESVDSTILVPPDASAWVDEYYCLHVRVV